MTLKLVIGTRGSQLALWQTEWVRKQLQASQPDIEIAVKVLSTRGDRVLDVSLPALGALGKGLFTQELEEALLSGEVDLAVHSLKDLPTELPAGLAIGAICERDDVRDALVARPGIVSFEDLPESAIVGTSSLRRASQLLAARPDLVVRPIRGNVDTRLSKLDAGEFDAIVLAAAGLRRLGRADCITQYLPEELMLPAPGQGALAVETRAEDPRVNDLIRCIEHSATRSACDAERSFLKELGGGCLVPIAARARIEGSTIGVDGLVASPTGSTVIRDRATGLAEDAAAVGRQLAQQMLKAGAGLILQGHPD